MVRAPCCEKMGLKKGPWTREEDAILVSYIHRYGHGNWRALPKQAGLLRCGKSCRLRWINYLRPDIKRGNFSKEEEDMIVSLHEMLGNRWSAIAARLPGRTDNEIKNVWHTHLKKRLKPAQSADEPKGRKTRPESKAKAGIEREPCPVESQSNSITTQSDSTADSSSFLSNVTTESMDFSSQESLLIDESFWNEALSMESYVDVPMEAAAAQAEEFSGINEQLSSEILINDEDINYWLRIFTEAGELPEL